MCMTAELSTIIDFIRYGASRFAAAGLSFSHNHDNALDEATHLVLQTLHLPHDLSPAYGQARLTGEEQKAVKTTAFDLQINPANPGLSFHKLDKARDKNFWSVRVGSDIRLIVHKSDPSLLLCYVDHHDKAYDWAERRKLEVHP